MDTGHLTLPKDQVKDMRVDLRFDDGSQFSLENEKPYTIQNTGAGEIRISERESSRGIPSLDSDDCFLLTNRQWSRITVKANRNYYAWSRGQDSVLGIGESAL